MANQRRSLPIAVFKTRSRTMPESPNFEPIGGRGSTCPDETGLTDFASIGAVYCMSLREQPRRTAAAVRHFRAIGMDRDVTLHMRNLGNHPVFEIWDGHRTIARRALEKGHNRVLILEDDARIKASRRIVENRLSSAISRLPMDWWGLHLCHFPIQAYPVSRGVLRARSGFACAYVANWPLLLWLASVEPVDPTIPLCAPIGAGVDAAFANLPAMFALWPMAAGLEDLGEGRSDWRPPRQSLTKNVLDVRFYRNILVSHGFGPAEGLALLLSPFHYLTLEAFRRRSSRRHASRVRRNAPAVAVAGTTAREGDHQVQGPE